MWFLGLKPKIDQRLKESIRKELVQFPLHLSYSNLFHHYPHVEAVISLDVREGRVFQLGLKPCGQHSPRPIE